MEALLAWFDLSARVTPSGSVVPLGPAAGPEMPLGQQVLLYAVVVVGVLLAESVAMARNGAPIKLDLSWTWVAVACLIALVVFPAVWREVGLMAESSLFVQLGLAAQGGVFWGVLMAGAEKQSRGR